MSGHCGFQVRLILDVDARQLLVECEQLEEVAVRLVGRARGEESRPTAGIDAAFFGALGEPLTVGSNVPDQPMVEHAAGDLCLELLGDVRIFNDQRKTLGLGRNVAERQRRIETLAVARILGRHFASVSKRRAADFQIRRDESHARHGRGKRGENHNLQLAHSRPP